MVIRREVKRLSGILARRLADERLTLELGEGLVVGHWLASEPVEAAFAPVDSPVPSAAFPEATLCGEGWRRHDEDNTFLTYLRGMNDERQLLLAACGLTVPRDTAAVVRLYSKKDIKVWLNGELVFVGQHEVKNIDELFFVTLMAGLNVFLVEKHAASLKFTVEEAGRSFEAMAAYLSPTYLQRARLEILVVPERLLGAGATFSCVLLPRDSATCRSAQAELLALAPGGECLWHGQVPVGVGFTVVLTGYEGPLELIADGGDGRSWGRRRLLVGAVDVQMARLRHLWETRRAWLDPRAAEDVGAWIVDLEDIWRAQESAAYEPRRWFVEEVDALCDAMGRLTRLMGANSAPDGQTVETALCRGLTLHSFKSRLDGSRQPYYAYIPRDYRPDRPRPVVVLLKYLYKKVQLPGFASDPVLARMADDCGAIFLCPYGRGINRYEYAGETDLFESLEDLASRYRLDERRVFLAGFSMGGGAAWTLLQKHPDRFAGAMGWSCNTVGHYAANLSGKRLVYLSGNRDAMFDYATNHAIVDSLGRNGGAEVVANQRLAGHHFSFYNIYNDVKLGEWAAAAVSSAEPRSQAFHTDDLHYRDAGWAEVVEAVDPGEMSEVSITRRDGRLEVSARNVERLRVRRPAGVGTLVVNGALIGGGGRSAWEVAGIGCGNPIPAEPHGYDINATGSGIAEIYYGSVAVIEADWRGDRKDPAEKWARRLARAFARPGYYGDFREKYAEIPVLAAAVCDLGDFEGRNLVLVGSRAENRWLRHIEQATGTRQLADTLAASVDQPVCALVFKTCGLTAGRRVVFVLIEDGAGLSAFADSALFKGQFTPPFTGEPDLMRHDGLVLCQGGEIRVARFDARWKCVRIESVCLKAAP